MGGTHIYSHSVRKRITGVICWATLRKSKYTSLVAFCSVFTRLNRRILTLSLGIINHIDLGSHYLPAHAEGSLEHLRGGSDSSCTVGIATKAAPHVLRSYMAVTRSWHPAANAGRTAGAWSSFAASSTLAITAVYSWSRSCCVTNEYWATRDPMSYDDMLTNMLDLCYSKLVCEMLHEMFGGSLVFDVSCSEVG